jgi:hypothetical protein
MEFLQSKAFAHYSESNVLISQEEKYLTEQPLP